MDNLQNFLSTVHSNLSYLPKFFRLNNPQDKQAIESLIESGQVHYIHDEITGQLQELIKSKNPSIKIKENDYPDLISKHLAGKEKMMYGVWVYYEWSKRLIHLLDEEEFIEVRTNRNRYKITREEQEALKNKKIGIVGLSVGQSIALTIATERVCGELRLADFDTAELSNLNRIRTGVHNLGIYKTIIAAREIMEIDPFLKVKIYNDGLNAENMNDFFLEGGKLDLFIEVCDGLDVKIKSRYKAKELQVPVVMDTNDRGMLDVERFDLEPDRPILHGLTDGLDPNNIKGLSNEEKIPYILKMIGAETLSTRLKASMMEVEQSINTWPQLASSVTLGGALTTDVSRRILLNQYHESGRYYLDIEDIVKDKKTTKQEHSIQTNPHTPIDLQTIKRITNIYFAEDNSIAYTISSSQKDNIINAALAAPSAGNNQPWKWVYDRNILFLFHDRYRSWSWGDYKEMGAQMALGAALENVHLQANAENLKDNVSLFPIEREPQLIAVIKFSKLEFNSDESSKILASHLYKRYTNRKLSNRQKLSQEFFNQLNIIALPTTTVNFFYIENENDLFELADIISECDKVRLLNRLGHEEFYHEIRWSRQQAEETKDGIELQAVDLTMSEMAGFKVAQDWNAVELLSNWDKGDAFKKLSLKAVESASAMILYTINDFKPQNLLEAGRVVQRSWIYANQQGVSIHPMLSPAFFFNRLLNGGGEGLSEKVKKDLTFLRQRFLKIFPLESNQSEVFLMKVALADDIGIRSLRKSKDELFFDLSLTN